MQEKEKRLKELEHKIFTLIGMGVSGRGDANRDIPIIQELAREHEKIRLESEVSHETNRP